MPIICHKSGFCLILGEQGSLYFSSWEQSFQGHAKELLLIYKRKEGFMKINFEIYLIMYKIHQF